MELLQCNANNGGQFKRAYHSEDREMSLSLSSSNSSSAASKSTVSKSPLGGNLATRAATLGGSGGIDRNRRISLPSGHYSATLGPMSKSSEVDKFRHYGSSLSLAEEHGKHELTRRTLRPPSPTTLRKSSTNLPPSAALNKSERSPKPLLPQMRVELESPKLADYLERPRLVNAIPRFRNEAVAASAHAHHAKRYENNAVPSYRNLRLGNFMEAENDEEDMIPERLRQYYLDTYLNVCDTYRDVETRRTLSLVTRATP